MSYWITWVHLHLGKANSMSNGTLSEGLSTSVFLQLMMRPIRPRRRSRDTGWIYYDGYPPDLRMRRRLNGAWEYRLANDKEVRTFQAAEAQFEARNVTPLKVSSV